MAYSMIEENERLRAKIAQWQSLLEDAGGSALAHEVAEEMAAVLEE